MKSFAPKHHPALRRRVIEWFRAEGRDLPWRRTRDPYAVLVSELMCQQTQVATVVPYYERWMRRFPTAAALAGAEEQEVMSLWQGLGYYSRARNLHRAAQAIVAAGEFPRGLEAIRALSGVGRYTAGAVMAFAYDEAAALVDANIARVLARLYAEPGDVWPLAEALQGPDSRLFNGGLMELGALVCTPRRPRCCACPVQRHCAAAARGIQEELPPRKARRAAVRIEEPCGYIASRGRILLEHQAGARWRGLWKLPAMPAAPAGEAPLAVIEYPFTHYKVRLSVHRAPAPRRLAPGCAWHPIAALEQVPIAAGHRRALRELLAVKTRLRAGQTGA